MSHYRPLNFRLKERIYENNDKSIVIFKTRKRQTITYIAVKAYVKNIIKIIIIENMKF